jgi:hypothetical protein
MGNAHLNLSHLYYESGQYHSVWDRCQKALQLGIAVPSSLVNEIRSRNSQVIVLSRGFLVYIHFFVGCEIKSFLESGWNNCYYFARVELAFF